MHSVVNWQHVVVVTFPSEDIRWRIDNEEQSFLYWAPHNKQKNF